MASSLAQQALDIVVNVQAAIQSGAPSERLMITDLAVAVQMLAQNALGATPSSESIGDGLTAVDVAPTSPDNTPS